MTGWQLTIVMLCLIVVSIVNWSISYSDQPAWSGQVVTQIILCIAAVIFVGVFVLR